MAKIQILSPQLASKIAAGEVIERPASVVKELVENALDARAQFIEVQIEAGGKDLIRVLDNGEGMEPQEVLLALERHATSKLTAEEDLWRLKTLGFRGEALPSIAAVSQFTLMSRTKGNASGMQALVEGGELKKAQEAGMPPGTRVEAAELFYNVPARKKFMKSEATETSRIVEVLENLALAYPAVHFRLLEKNKVLLNLNPAADHWRRWREVLGEKPGAPFLTLEELHPDIELLGLLSSPEQAKSSWAYMRLLANGRSIKDRSLYQAILLGYGTLLTKGRYPQGILSLQINPAQIDVNVHPTKAEVRFAEPGKIFSFIHKAVGKRLSSFLPPGLPAGASHDYSASRYGGEGAAAGSVAGDRPAASRLQVPSTSNAFTTEESSPHVDQNESTLPLFPLTAASRSLIEGARVVGQIEGTYIVAQNRDYFFLIDQHAAHERILFERLQKQWEQKPTQELLYPVTWELSSGYFSLLERNQEVLKRLGFVMEPFGPRAMLIRAAPPFINPENMTSFLEEILDKIQGGETSADFSQVYFAFLASAACRAAEMARHDLSIMEMQALLEDLMKTERPNACPHGRPTVIEYPLEDVRKRFKRTR